MQTRSSIDLEWISTGGHRGAPIGANFLCDIVFRPSPNSKKFGSVYPSKQLKNLISVANYEYEKYYYNAAYDGIDRIWLCSVRQ